jgi:hypothetical protein
MRGYGDGVGDRFFPTHEFFLYYGRLIFFNRIECSSGKKHAQ